MNEPIKTSDALHTRDELRKACSHPRTKVWRVEKGTGGTGEFNIVSDQSYYVAATFGGSEPFECARQNAYMIAAAPNLLRALHDLVNAAPDKNTKEVQAAYAAIDLAADFSKEGYDAKDR